MATRPNFESEIELTDSSLINRVRYDAESWILDIKLKSGQTYRYRDVAPSKFSRLVTRQSSGQIYNEEIKRTGYGTPRKATKIRSW